MYLFSVESHKIPCFCSYFPSLDVQGKSNIHLGHPGPIFQFSRVIFSLELSFNCACRLIDLQ